MIALLIFPSLNWPLIKGIQDIYHGEIWRQGPQFMIGKALDKK